MNRPFVMISGWAHPADSMNALAEALGETCRASLRAASIDGVDLAEESVLLGWSLGGMLAMELAARRPERVAALVLISTTPRFCSRPNLKLDSFCRARMVERPSRRARREGHTNDHSRPTTNVSRMNDPAFAGGAAVPDFSVPEAHLRAMMRQLRKDAATTLTSFVAQAAAPHLPVARPLETSLEVLQGGLRYLRETDLTLMVPGIRCPAMILHGRQDAIIPHAAGAWLAGHLPAGRLVSVENMGHDLPLRRPEWVAREVRAFLS